jgi:hypothetical protein
MTEPNSQFEEHQRDLDPHRVQERRDAATEVDARLRDLGVVLTGRETSEELVDMLEAIEAFEAMVEAKGGDLFVNSIQSSQPETPAFVLPRRSAHESPRDYILKVSAATDRIRHIR